MNYKSLLTKDFKNSGQLGNPSKTMGLKRTHVALVLTIVGIVGLVLSFVSLDAKAKRHVQSLNDDPLNRIVMPIEIPATTPNTTTPATETTNTTATADAADDLKWIHTGVKAGDSLAVIFKRNNLDAGELHEIMQAGEETKTLKRLVPGQTFHIQVGEDNSIQTLLYDINQLETLAINRDGDEFIASYHHKNVEKRINHASAVINSSLFESGRSAGLSNQMIMELAHIFGWDIDFALDIREGDTFSLIFEEDFLNGSKINDGPILAAEFVNQGNSYKAIRYTDDGGRSDYYDPDGNSMRKAFLRTPVDFRRISSRFGNRLHPTLNQIRMHKGVDYAAPTGTPIKASGDGKVIFTGRKGGYGNVIILQHGGQYSTLYGHMSGFRRGVNVGKRVKQGQIIGYVGSTGRATGPHLHYEFLVNGVYRNPLTVKLPDAQPIDPKYKPAFENHAQTLLSQLSMFKQSSLALNHQ